MSTVTTSLKSSAARIAADTLDVERIRADFPILAQMVHGKRLVYLDNAATTQKPRAVIDATSAYYEQINSNIHRGAHTLAVRATDAYEASRRTAQQYINAAREEEVVFVRGTTDGINLVASSYGRMVLKPGDEVLLTEMEHHSNIVPWQLACEQTGAKVVVAPINDRGELIFESFERLLSPRTKIVAVAHVSNALGTINPLRKIIDAAHAAGAVVLVDGAQAVAHLRVDVQALDCDFYVFSGHKLYGPTGIGILYGKHALLNRMPPYQGGGSMIRSVTFEKTTFLDPPLRFEGGTPNIAGVVGLMAAIGYVESIGLDRIARHEHELLEFAEAQLRTIEGLRLIGTASEKASIISFVVDGIHADDIGRMIDRDGVAIRVGHHCAEPLMKRFGVTATARASIAVYNTREDVQALVAAVRKAVNVAHGSCAVQKVEVRPSSEGIEQTQTRIVKEFSGCPDWESKYQRIIDVGKSHPHIPEEYKQDKLKVKGCQSTVWLHAKLDGDKIVFTSESDALIVNGLVALLLRVFSNRTPDEILGAEPHFIRDIGLPENLSQVRSNGLAAMVREIKTYAAALKQLLALRKTA